MDVCLRRSSVWFREANADYWFTCALVLGFSLSLRIDLDAASWIQLTWRIGVYCVVFELSVYLICLRNA